MNCQTAGRKAHSGCGQKTAAGFKNNMWKILILAASLCILTAFTALADESLINTEGMSADEIMKLGPGYASSSGTDASGTAGTSAAQTDAQQAGRTIDPTKPMIAITYDDGPCTGPGNRIMDVFLKYGQRCTFFLVGNRVADRAAEVKRMADNGFEIGNHSWSHKYYNKLSSEQIREDIERCNNVIYQYAGVKPRICRTPGGIKSGSIMSSLGMPNILWNIDTLDWKTRNADSTVNAVLGKVKDGDIILMHELYGATATATERLVPELVARGYQLVTVSELAQYKGVTLTAGNYYFSFK